MDYLHWNNNFYTKFRNIQGGFHILPILKSIVFVLLLLSSFFVTDFVFFKIVIEDSFEHKQSLNYSDANNVDIVFVGTSHTRNAINHEFIPNSFNFAGSGKNHLLSYYQLKQIMNKDLEIDTLVVEIDQVSFSNHIYTEPFLFPNPNYYTGFYTLEDAMIIQEKNQVDVYLEYLFPFVGRGKEFIKTENAEKFEGFRSGYVNSIEKDFVPNERGVEAFLEIVKLAKENNMRLILIKQPYLKEYASESNDSEFYENLFSKVNNITLEYEFFDYSNFFTSTEYFSDAYHLNDKGAKKFTKYLNQKVVLTLE